MVKKMKKIVEKVIQAVRSDLKIVKNIDKVYENIKIDEKNSFKYF